MEKALNSFKHILHISPIIIVLLIAITFYTTHFSPLANDNSIIFLRVLFLSLLSGLLILVIHYALYEAFFKSILSGFIFSVLLTTRMYHLISIIVLIISFILLNVILYFIPLNRKYKNTNRDTTRQSIELPV